MRTVLVYGAGKSANEYEAPKGIDVAAISSGIYSAPWPVDEWFCIDRPYYYRGNYMSMARAINVPRVNFRKGYKPMVDTSRLPTADLFRTLIAQKTPWDPGWQDWPQARAWDVDPPLAVPNTFLLALRLLPQMGYRHLHFIGCDFQDHYNDKAVAAIRDEWPIAAGEGQLWTVSSEASALSDFLTARDMTCSEQSPALSLAS